MALKNIDIAKESTVVELASQLESRRSIFSSPEHKSLDKNVIYIMNMLGGTNNAIVNVDGVLYYISDDSTEMKIYDYGNGSNIVSSLPFAVDVHESNVIVYHGEIHLLGGREDRLYSHYKWDGKSWKVASTLPIPFCSGKAIVYNDEIHIIGGDTYTFGYSYDSGNGYTSWANKHYKWDGETWLVASTLPTDYQTRGCILFTYGSNLHMIGGTIIDGVDYGKTHYVWDKTSWSKSVDLPTGRFNSAAVYTNVNGVESVYLVGGNKPGLNSKLNTIFKMSSGSGTPNTFVDTGVVIPDLALSDAPQHATNYYGVASTTDYNIVIAGSRFVKFNGTNNWKNDFTFGEFSGGSAVDYNGEIHVFSGVNHHIYHKDTHRWSTEIDASPYDMKQSCAVVMDDGIHVLGSSNESYADYHRVWNETVGWKTLPNLPFKLTSGYAAIYKDELHVVFNYGSNDNGNYNHYKLLSNRWVPVSRVKGTYSINKSESFNISGLRTFGDNLCALGVRINHITSSETSSTITQLVNYILVYDGTGWKSIFIENEDLDDRNTGYVKSSLAIIGNRLAYTEYITATNGGEETNYAHIRVLMSDNSGIPTKRYFGYNSIGVGDRYTIDFEKNNKLYFVLNSENCKRDSVIYTDFCIQSTVLLSAWLLKGSTFYCDKSYFLPITPPMEELPNGYRAPSDGLYYFYDAKGNVESQEAEPFSIG